MAFAKKGAVSPLDLQMTRFFVVGTTPVMTQRFSEKPVAQILGKQGQLATSGRALREPEMDLCRACHVTVDQHLGMPALAFKQIMVRGAKITNQLPMTDARAAFRVMGDSKGLVALYGTPEMDINYVRNDGGGGTDIRFRPRMDEWAAMLLVQYNQGVVSAEQLGQCLVAGGFGVGLGEHRPDKDGDKGTFRLGTEAEFADIRSRHEPGIRTFFKKHETLFARVAQERGRLLEVMAALGISTDGFDEPDAGQRIAKPKVKKNG